MRILKEEEIKKYISDEELQNFYNDSINDAHLNELLAYYSYLKNNVSAIPLDKQSIYYSIYYWYVQFKERYFQVYGHDSGIEQEGFKLLEELDYQLEDGVNWGLIEKIELKDI
ncbi:MAG: hypothetical protein E7L01_00345 [Paenibacillus macerans]|uniref:Uncharacterized protein n=1 Tax=Paenibacillus macerans TaxID=44252 RepID=A0A090Y7X3_PAEMA|nr:hypothetical protein [Paenibacillus macerans]KFM94296.1 hypothetical protein DJ90_1383 [Paenibacillus macerans]MBS5909615.1 hypothetical protein [Paenibacillus macerans]MCY7557280.1 hypothetical protein [Paenibacillus macerans]MDU5945546.1 hypothetical protein [Paenibacillus macerans]MDU7471796.1 hypothetical protein [Paenibacillus macerans]